MVLTIGILGAGRIGRIHCDNALNRVKNVKLMALCDPHLDHDWASSKEIPFKLCDETEFFKKDFAALIICSPSSEHARQVALAIKHKKHILCEKPLDQSLEKNLDIKRKLESNPELKFQIGFNRRFDGDFSKIASDLGLIKDLRPYFIRITSRDPKLPPMTYLVKSGGLFLDMSIHDFDMARFVMKSEVSEVYARANSLLNPELKSINDFDTAVISLKFENGAFGVIDNSRQAVYGYDQRLEVFTNKGSFFNRNHRESRIEFSDYDGCKKDRILDFFLERYQESYKRELECFAKGVLENKTSSPGINDAIAAVKIAYAANQSLISNSPIKVKDIQ